MRLKGAVMGSEEVRQKIVMSTIQCIEKYGLEHVTTRRITEMSGVNVAAINYHFGSKDNLIKAVLKITLDEGFVNNINDYNEEWSSHTYHALENFLKDTLTGMMNYPNLTKAHFQESFNNNTHDGYSINRFNKFLTTFQTLVKDLLKSTTEQQQKLDIIQIWSALMVPGMMPGIFREFLGSDLTDPEDQSDYIKSILEHYIKK